MSLPTSYSLQVKANGVDVSASIDWSSLDLVLVLTKEVSTFKFNVLNPGGTSTVGTKYKPTAGDQIDLYETTTLNSTNTTAHIFGGTITEIETVVDGGLVLVAQVTCTDWGYKMDSKLIVSSYGAMDPADIVAAIVPAGFDTSTYVKRAGYNLTTIKFNYEPVTKCLQALANQIGWNWYVDADKKVHFFLEETNSAPFVIDDTTGGLEWQTLDIDVNLQNMKNSVFVIGGTYASVLGPSATPDVYLGDGTRVAFGLVYAYTPTTVTVTLNGTVQSIGVANQVTNPSAYQVLYDIGNKVVTFNTVPGSGAVVKVYGTAEIPIVGHAIDQTGIATYGEFQDAVFDGNIKSIAEAQQRAQAEILLYGHAVYDVKFNTLTPGCRVGMTIYLNSATFGISNYPLTIKRIEAKGRRPDQLEYSIECIGSDQVTFVDLMSGILQQENANTTVDNTVLEVLLGITESSVGTDTLHALTPTTGPYLVGSTAIVGFCTMG